MTDPTFTTGKYPVPPGQQCQWPGCSSQANGSVAVGSQGTERLYLCLDHLGRAADLITKSRDSRKL